MQIVVRFFTTIWTNFHVVITFFKYRVENWFTTIRHIDISLNKQFWKSCGRNIYDAMTINKCVSTLIELNCAIFSQINIRTRDIWLITLAIVSKSYDRGFMLRMLLFVLLYLYMQKFSMMLQWSTSLSYFCSDKRCTLSFSHKFFTYLC